jgi:cell cycle arrest protein BUB2
MAFGLHLNVVCVVAQLILMRKRLLSSSDPYREVLHYRKWPALRARMVISLTMQLLPRIDAQLYRYICRHGKDQDIVSTLIGRNVKYDLPSLSSSNFTPE